MAAADKASSRVRRAFRRALQRLGRLIQADIRDSINIRVEYIGGMIIRSDPGEPPRREFGDLWRSIKFRIQIKSYTIDDLEVYTDSIVAVYLEYGTDRIEPRPFWEPARRRAVGLRGLLKQFFAEELARDDDTDVDLNESFEFADDRALPEGEF